MKLEMSMRILRWMIPLLRWALGNLEKKHFHSVEETEKLEAFKRLVKALEH